MARRLHISQLEYEYPDSPTKRTDNIADYDASCFVRIVPLKIRGTIRYATLQ